MMRAMLRLWRDRAAGALVEFALLLPVMLLLLVGFAEGLQVVEAHRRVSRAASTVGDLAAQYRSLNETLVSDVFAAGALMMDPMPAATLGQRLMSFSSDANGVVKLEWTRTGPVAYAGNAPAALPAGYELKPNQGVVVADVSYAYAPMTKWVLPASINMQKRMLLRPRAANWVQLE